jgi:threonyl-tRNA synthetase
VSSNQKASQSDLYAMRHSLAHIMAAAIQHLWPQAKFGVGPVIEDGFYYDVDLDATVTLDALARIEKQMAKIIKANYPFEKFELGIDEAIDKVKQQGQIYKVELLRDLKSHGTTNLKGIGAEQLGVAGADKVAFYRSGDFEDLCRGPHVASTGQVGAFKLHKVSGAYWRAKDTNPQLQRIYGVAFATQAEVQQYFKRLEEAKRRDHRVLGSKLGIYMQSELVGAGLPLLLPNGETIKQILIDYMRAKEVPLGYKYVSTPVLAHEELYERSGHAAFYADDMYSLTDDENNKFYLKPMNCPHHHMIYEQMVQSYRDLPLKLAEAGGLYRHELSGTLTGLIRVRGPITQNDAHIYVTPDQLKAEFLAVLDLFEEVYRETGVGDYWFRLSLPDFESSKFAGDSQRWDQAAVAIREALTEHGSEFVEAEGEAAFYGPKLDVQTENVLGKEDTIATVQVDILVPGRMGLKYIDAEGKEQFPVIIHRSILGSYERFIGFLLEKTAGNLPLWLAPEQVRVVSVSGDYAQFAQEVVDKLSAAGLRAQLDSRNESVGKKIREAELMKLPYTVVIGQKEQDRGKVTPRVRADLAVAKEQSEMEIANFAQSVANESKSRARRASL